MAPACRQSAAHRSSAKKIANTKTPSPKYLHNVTPIPRTQRSVRTCDRPRKSLTKTLTPYRFRYASTNHKITPVAMSTFGSTLRRGPARKAKLFPSVEGGSDEDDTDEDEISMDESKFEAVMSRRRSLSQHSRDTQARTPLGKNSIGELYKPAYADNADLDNKSGDYVADESGNETEDFIVVKVENPDARQGNAHKGSMNENSSIFETSWKESSAKAMISEVDWENRRLMDENLQLKSDLGEERAKSAQLEWKLSESMGGCVAM